ncbi:hypothetical protein GDO78_008829 [Eleutherodactylus coqui]|uniref:Uncharacterized protein n=1 Tax=Eleutherodactylus coqui TaxID=57060 RepID=A0A8J6K9Q3_ELECQ|nr:hypothetical protein GDO78_008829 [Eleutherodactylus coqui]
MSKSSCSKRKDFLLETCRSLKYSCSFFSIHFFTGMLKLRNPFTPPKLLQNLFLLCLLAAALCFHTLKWGGTAKLGVLPISPVY